MSKPTATCPHCQSSLPLKSEKAVGRKVPCPRCRRQFVVKLDATSDVEKEDWEDYDSSDESLPTPAPRRTYGTPRRSKRRSKSWANSYWLWGAMAGLVVVPVLLWAVSGPIRRSLEPLLRPTMIVGVDELGDQSQAYILYERLPYWESLLVKVHWNDGEVTEKTVEGGIVLFESLDRTVKSGIIQILGPKDATPVHIEIEGQLYNCQIVDKDEFEQHHLRIALEAIEQHEAAQKNR